MMRMTIMMLMSMMMDDNDENIDYSLVHVDDEHRTLIFDRKNILINEMKMIIDAIVEKSK